jgi:hypothetical protein
VYSILRKLACEQDALRKDAERYRWLRDVADGAEWEWAGTMRAAKMDAFVDAAMRSVEKL